jgi:type I restriction-modification system DNA methylase subunit
MNEDIQRTIQASYKAFLHSSYTRNDFVDILLSLVALHWISDAADNYQPGISPIAENLRSPGEAFHFSSIMRIRSHENIKYEFERATDQWERENPDVLKGLLRIESTQLKDIPYHRWEDICGIWRSFFDNWRMQPVREITISVFNALELFLAEQRGANEGHTPSEVVKIMLEAAENKKSIFDPYCRTGNSLFLAAALNSFEKISGYTQANLPWKLANLRILLEQSVTSISINKGDGLADVSTDKKFDFIFLNPPFGGASAGLSMPHHGSWSNNFFASSRMEIAYLCSSLDQLANNGQMRAVIPNILLSGQGQLKAFRTKLIDENLLEAIILLPPKIFPGTGVSTAILYLKKGRTTENVFLLDASDMSHKKGNQIYLNFPEVKELFNKKNEQDPQPSKHIKVVQREDIIEHDYDLQFSIYEKLNDNFFANLLSAKGLLKECDILEEKLAAAKARVQAVIAEKHNTIY